MRRIQNPFLFYLTRSSPEDASLAASGKTQLTAKPKRLKMQAGTTAGIE
jgi:hypothetical protein